MSEGGTRTRSPITSIPWKLTEFAAAPTTTSHSVFGNLLGGCSASDLTSLREKMQEQHVAAVALARREAFEAGRSAGRADATAAAEEDLASAVRAASTAAAAIAQHEEHYAGVLEENLVALATAIARQVIQREVQLEPSFIRGLVQESLAEFPQEHTLRVRVHPTDYSLLASDPGYRDITWMSDPRIESGGCVVEGRERIVDGRVDVALEHIYRRLTSGES